MAAYTNVPCSNCGEQNYICLENESYVEIPVSFEFTCSHCKTLQNKKYWQSAFDIDTPAQKEIVIAKIVR